MVVQGCQRLKAVLKERRKIMEQLCTDWYSVWQKSRRQWTNGISHTVCAVTEAVHVSWSLVLPQELWEMFSQCSTSDSSQWEKSNRFTLNSTAIKSSLGLGNRTPRLTWLMEWIWILLGQMVKGISPGETLVGSQEECFYGMSSLAAFLFSGWSRVHIWDPLEN